jgi:hypothetical protein
MKLNSRVNKQMQNSSSALNVVTVPPPTGTNDEVLIQNAVSSLGSNGGVVQLDQGTYVCTSTGVSVTGSNIWIQGMGIGITKVVAGAGMDTTKPLIEFANSTASLHFNLAQNTAVGDQSVLLGGTDGTQFSPNTWVLLSSSKQVDTENNTKFAGELHQVTGVSGNTITFDDIVLDTYLLTDEAKLTIISMNDNNHLSDIEIYSQQSASDLSIGFLNFRFQNNLIVNNMRIHDYFHSVQFSSCINFKVHDIHCEQSQGTSAGARLRYGIWVAAASQNGTISHCSFKKTRHGVTVGGQSGQNYEGMQRAITILNCTSSLTDTAHFDTHEPCENIVFEGCSAIGGVEFSGSGTLPIVGIQIRGRNNSVIGCTVDKVKGRGIMVFGPTSNNTMIVGNYVNNILSVSWTHGIGIYFDNSGTSNNLIASNTIANCDSGAITIASPNNNTIVNGNIMMNNNRVIQGSPIYLKGGKNWAITNNLISGAPDRPIKLLSGADNYIIANNQFVGNNRNDPDVHLAINSQVVNNIGYNPFGLRTNPWPALGGDLINDVSSGAAMPVSGTTYTVRQTPKTIIISGGTVSQILINGVNVGQTAGAFKLGIGETINVTYSATPTVSQIRCD